jgi:hypothetical protein
MGNDQAVAAQAYRLVESVFRSLSPRPTTPPEKVARIVYALLVEDVDPKTIALALQRAKAHTPAGIDYAIRTLIPSETGMRPRIEPIAPVDWPTPTEEQRAHAREAIAEARRRLRGTG